MVFGAAGPACLDLWYELFWLRSSTNKPKLAGRPELCCGLPPLEVVLLESEVLGCSAYCWAISVLGLALCTATLLGRIREQSSWLVLFSLNGKILLVFIWSRHIRAF